MEALHGDAEPRRIAAHVVERQQPPVTVEGCVLDAFGHDRRRRLLKADHELRRYGILEQQHPLKLRIEARHRRAVLIRHRPGHRIDVRPVHRQRREAPAQHIGVKRRSQPGEPLDFRPERAPNLLELGLLGDIAEPAIVPGDPRPQLGERPLADRIDEQRADIVQELVAHRPAHRPVAQVLGWIEDLLHPHPASPSGPKPRQVLRRVGEAVGMIDPEAVHEPAAQK